MSPYNATDCTRAAAVQAHPEIATEMLVAYIDVVTVYDSPNYGAVSPIQGL